MACHLTRRTGIADMVERRETFFCQNLPLVLGLISVD